MPHKSLKPVKFHLNKHTKVFVWAGAWSLFDRSAASRFSLRQCVCHRFTLFIGPIGVEIDHDNKGTSWSM